MNSLVEFPSKETLCHVPTDGKAGPTSSANLSSIGIPNIESLAHQQIHLWIAPERNFAGATLPIVTSLLFGC